MAEVAGLVLGTVALASLYKTCIELFDSFELGKNYTYDYQLACTKVSLLQARLRTWGGYLNIEKPGDEYAALREHWKEEQDVIGRSLSGIRDTFENTSLLTKRYKLTPQRSWAHRSKQSLAAGETKPIQNNDLVAAKAGGSVWINFRKRTTWAIHDKARFDGFIRDLSFLIENLEKVTERLAMPKLKKEASKGKDNWLSQGSRRPDEVHKQLSLKEKVEAEKIRDTTSTKPRVTDRKPMTHVETLENAVVDKVNGHVFKGSQTANNSVAIMGTLGKGTRRQHLYLGNQSATNNGFVIMGEADPEAYSAVRCEGVRTRMKEGLSMVNKDSGTYDSSDSEEEDAGIVLSRKLKQLKVGEAAADASRSGRSEGKERRR